VIKNLPLGVGSGINIPQFTVPSASQLSNIQIPTTFEDQLRSLNNSIPTLEDLREKLDSLISVPFQLIKKEINDTFLAAEGSFVATPLPVPQEATVTFCGDTVSSSFDDLANDLVGIARTGIYIVIASMVLLFIGHAILTWHSQRSLRANIERIRHLWFGDGTATTERLLAFDALVSHPIWSRIVNFLSEKLHLSQGTYNALTWFGLYVFHPAPLACLLIGIFGLLSVQIQIAIIRPLQGRYSDQISNDISGLANTIALKLNDTMYQDSAAYAQSLNTQISAVETTINSDLFGWVNATIVPLNTTLATFYTEVQDTVNTLLGGTPFDAPAQEFVRCILGSKVTSIERALTFLQENLHVNLPRVNETALVLSQSNINEVATPISAAAVGSGDDGEDGGLVGKIITQYIQTLEKERVNFFIFLLLWGAVALVALLIIAWHTMIVPALHRGGLKVPRWLAGPSWERTSFTPPLLTFLEVCAFSGPSTHDTGHTDPEKARFNDLGGSAAPVFAPIPSPLFKHPNVAAKSTSATIVGGVDHDRLRKRRPGDVKVDSDLESFLDAAPRDERSAFFQKLRTFTFGRRHVAKKDSDSAILPFAKSSELPMQSSEQRHEDSGRHGWFDRMAFWKRGVSGDGNADDSLTAPRGFTAPRARDTSPTSSLDHDISPSHHSGSNRSSSGSREKRKLTVDVAKASAPVIMPRIVLERPDYRLELIDEPTPPNAPRPSRTTADDAPGRNGLHLAVPSSSRPRKPAPPAWVIAMQEKESSLNGKARPRGDPSDRDLERRPGDNSNGPRRPPGLEGERSGRYPAYPKPVATSTSRDRYPRNERGERSLRRNASIPPRSPRAQTDPRRQQQRNRILSRASSFDAADPFATPPQPLKPLPAPLEPVKLQAPRLKSNNPFSTPFDDTYAIKPNAPEKKPTHNFSMPSSKQGKSLI